MNAVQTYITLEESKEASGLLQFERTLSFSEKKELLAFVHGAIFAKHLFCLAAKRDST